MNGRATLNASARTLARHFQSETGLSFGAWRQQARVLEAMGRLGSGAPVTQVALDLGYDSVSAFSAMFRRAAGASPSAYRASPLKSPVQRCGICCVVRNRLAHRDLDVTTAKYPQCATHLGYALNCHLPGRGPAPGVCC